MNPSDSLKQDVCGTIDRARGRIVEIGEAIMDAPELGFKEHRTADRVRETLEGLGLELEDGLEMLVDLADQDLKQDKGDLVFKSLLQDLLQLKVLVLQVLQELQ